MKPLDGLLVLDMSQFLAGPIAATRLADLGARVIKIERPGTGDLGRQLYINELELDGDSTLFHSINRNKQSFAVDLKDPAAVEQVRRLIAEADVLIQNFRPGVIERLGLDYERVRELNPRLVYGSITGYGDRGPWRDLPGQDLLAQARSGLLWLTGDADDPPTPMGLAVADMFTGAALVQGLLACLVRRGVTGEGGHVEISLLEAMVDLQLEVLTTHLNDGGQPPRRSEFNNAHAYLSAPYGVYATADGYLAVAMTPIDKLGDLIDLPQLREADASGAFKRRDEFKRIIADRLATKDTDHWLGILEPAGVWCASVMDWATLLEHDAFKVLDLLQTVRRRPGVELTTTRCPLRINGQRMTSALGAPAVGQHNDEIARDFGLTVPT